jgi:hypothetical protein
LCAKKDLSITGAPRAGLISAIPSAQTISCVIEVKDKGRKDEERAQYQIAATPDLTAADKIELAGHMRDKQRLIASYRGQFYILISWRRSRRQAFQLSRSKRGSITRREW